LALNSRLERTMRRFLHDLTVLAAVTAAGGFALTRAASPSASQSLPTRPMFVGDRGTPLDEAMHVLRNAPRFAGASVGAAGTVPTEIVAWLTILHDPAAEAHFLQLVRSATPAGRAYALTGLRAMNLTLFQEAARPLRRSETLVNTFFGRTAGITTTARIIGDLDLGTWIGEFVSASRVRYFGDLPWPQ
jgi:hypothetical protein